MTRRMALIFGVLAVILLLTVVREEPRLLVGGWCLFLWHNLGQVTVNPAGVATGLGAILLLLGATQYLGRWWYSAISCGSDTPNRRWRFRWSLSVVILLLLMFAVGFSAIGVARHAGWLLSCKEPLYVERVDKPENP